MTIDLKDLSKQQLDTLINKATKRKSALAKRKPVASVRRKITALAKSEGYTVAELFGTGATKARKAATSTRKGKKLGKVAPKYRNPAKKSETWSGRGRQPLWLAAHTAKGKTLESFLIKKTPARKAKPRKAKPRKSVARKAK